MTTQPTWSAVDNDTASLLDLLAEQHPATPQQAHEWKFFLSVLEDVASANGGLIDQNLTRPRFRTHVAAPRIGAFFNRAAREGLVRAEGYTETTRSPSGNGGKPAKSYRWLGT